MATEGNKSQNLKNSVVELERESTEVEVDLLTILKSSVTKQNTNNLKKFPGNKNKLNIDNLSKLSLNIP